MARILLYATAAALRLVLILYAARMDEKGVVKYTDIDYVVFSDAACFVTKGYSPYRRSTYRYSPFLALLLAPNALGLALWGKFLFCLADLGLARYPRRTSQSSNISEIVSQHQCWKDLHSTLTLAHKQSQQSQRSRTCM